MWDILRIIGGIAFGLVVLLALGGISIYLFRRSKRYIVSGAYVQLAPTASTQSADEAVKKAIEAKNSEPPKIVARPSLLSHWRPTWTNTTLMGMALLAGLFVLLLVIVPPVRALVWSPATQDSTSLKSSQAATSKGTGESIEPPADSWRSKILRPEPPVALATPAPSAPTLQGPTPPVSEDTSSRPVMRLKGPTPPSQEVQRDSGLASESIPQPVWRQNIPVGARPVPMPKVPSDMKMSAVPEPQRCVLLLDSNLVPLGQNCNPSMPSRGGTTEKVVEYLQKIPSDRENVLVAITVCPKGAPMTSGVADSCL